MSKSYCVYLLFLFVSLTSVFGAEFPEKLTIDVTYYDYHSDGSNPDFNPGVANDIIIEGLVELNLNSDGNPVSSTEKMFFSENISRWYEPWEDKGYVPEYHYFYGDSAQLVPTDGNDTSFINIIIEETLSFKHTENGTYTFTSAEFFPLDDTGFGRENTKNWNGEILSHHNYSFAMKCTGEFRYRKGLHFTFLGDDDAWLFLNNTLVLDVGGCHPAAQKSVSLDTLTEHFGFREGEAYSYSFFYTERQAEGSYFSITTNLFTDFDAVNSTVSPVSSRHEITGYLTRDELFLNVLTGGMSSISVHTPAGRELFSQELVLARGASVIPLKLLPGIYLVSVSTGSGTEHFKSTVY